MEELRKTVSFINVGRMILLTDMNIKKKNPLFKDFKEGVFLVSALTSTNQPANNVSSP